MLILGILYCFIFVVVVVVFLNVNLSEHGLVCKKSQ